MNTKHFRNPKSLLLTLALGIALAITSTSCTTTYDHHGRPAQTVDPGVAIAGAAAAGLVGYAIANNRSSNQHRTHHHHNYNRQHHGRHYNHPRHGRHYYR